MVEYMLAGDADYDGKYIVGVKTTGIYCLPSCHPPRKPKPENVEFHATPEEARAAGFRPCKLCRPDDFYLGRYAGEALVEGLVAGVALDPSAYRGVSALTAAAGVSTSKLHELFRTHYHTTPADLLTRARIIAARIALLNGRRQVAEIAFDVGFESLSAFNENFRKHTAMNPLSYRHLQDCPIFELALPGDYPIGRILRYLGRDDQSVTEHVAGHTFTTALRLGDGPENSSVTVHVTLRPGIARCEIGASSPLSAPALEQLHERLSGALGLTLDPARFESRVADAAELAPLIAGQRGLRIPLIADPFDALVRAIIGQQINLAFAATLRRRLIERMGTDVGNGLFLAPAPEVVAALDLSDLTLLGFSKTKAEHLIEAARAVADGRLPLAALVGKSATRVERTLLAVRGIGPWSTHYLMMRSFGFLDCVPVEDTALTMSLQRFFTLADRPGKRETLALMERFSPYRSLATFHLWQRLASAA